MNSSVEIVSVMAVDVRFEGEMIRVQLSDGREVTVPQEWFPRLRDASNEQQKNWRLIGVGLHWEELDEDISVEALLRC